MGYAVFHRDEAGAPTLEDVASLEAALDIVERSRNGDGPEDVRVFREVPIEVRTYYKVQVAEGAEGAGEAGGVVAAADESPAADQSPAPADEPSAAPLTVADEVAVAAVEDDPYDVRRLLQPASVTEADRSLPPAAPPPGAFPLAGPAVTQPTVEVHAANVDDEDGPAKRHSLFGRGG